MKKKPLLKRLPILNRVPIIQRHPVYSRFSWEKCCLCSSNVDCSGRKFSRLSSKVLKSCVSVYVSKKFNNWKHLENQLWKLGTQGVPLRLITEVNLPKEVVWAASYSSDNVVQINLNMMEYNNEIKWVDNLMSVLNRCGVYCVLCLNPIVPGVVKTYHVVELLARLRNHGKFHVNLKFCRVQGELFKSSGWINFNGNPIPEKWMVNHQGVWECTPEFQHQFLEKVQLYSLPKKLSVSICGTDNNCTGLKTGG